MTRPDVTAGPIERARSPVNMSAVKAGDCENSGPTAIVAIMTVVMSAKRFIGSCSYTLGRARMPCDDAAYETRLHRSRVGGRCRLRRWSARRSAEPQSCGSGGAVLGLADISEANAGKRRARLHRRCDDRATARAHGLSAPTRS